MLNKRRLLLVDSSDSLRTILYREISSEMPDLDIIACATGKEAITAVKRYEFEIITTGITLNDMDGYQLIDNIRQSAKNRNTAIFVVSGNTDTKIMNANSDDTTAVTAYLTRQRDIKRLLTLYSIFSERTPMYPSK